MLFYERRLPDHLKEKHAHLLASPPLLKSPVQIKDTNAEATEEIDRKTEQSENDTDFSEIKMGTDLNKTNTANCDTKIEEKVVNTETEIPSTSTGSSQTSLIKTTAEQTDNLVRPQLSKELEDWIWQDNRQFLQDRNIFEHTYFK